MLLAGKQINTGIIRTNDSCRGCNKCISGCPGLSANVAVNENGKNKIYVDQSRCTVCGRCMDLCTHDAREYADDTEAFFNDLRLSAAGKRKKKISLIIAPSFLTNYPQKYTMILGYLKHLGVSHIYSVSLGADITVWAYIQYLNTHKQKGMISQPCPAIVNYVEMMTPTLLPKLMPVQSPMMCTATYLRKYTGLHDDIAFISPCIAKKTEIERDETTRNVHYNVTFANLIKAIGDEDISHYYAGESEIEYGIGAIFSMPGGLRENIEYYMGLQPGSFVNQKEGETYSYGYLDLYNASHNYEDPYRAVLIDALNCTRGCNYGTATEFKHTASNHIPYAMNSIRFTKAQMFNATQYSDGTTQALRLAALNRRFAKLRLEDFLVTYQNRKVETRDIPKEEIASIMHSMFKFSDTDQMLDCASCGYHSCHEMAKAIAMGYNYIENCGEYVKKNLTLARSESMLQKQAINELASGQLGANTANIDQLTGLPNRYAFEQGLERALRNARKLNHTGYLFSLDIDDFMSINDGYGHGFGNALLMECAQFFRAEFQSSAKLFRAGGDEFMILLENANEADARTVRDTIIRRMRDAWNVMGERVYCTMSMGYVHFPEADDGMSDIIKNADLAVFKAKQQGKNVCVRYERALDQETHDQVNMIRQMRDCVAQDFHNFSVHYQPWITGGKIIGSEALMRWKDNTGKVVSPATFIPVAERIGLIIPLGEFVLRTAALLCKKICAILPDYLMSINVSAKQLNQPNVFERLFNVIKETGVNPHNIVLEVTESLGFENIQKQKQALSSFSQKGILIALDDFGTGYSSLSYLNELPLDLIKIDRSFISNIDKDDYSRHLVSTISDLMHHMGRRICVEGVETEEQVAYCRDAGIDILQGYYYHKPMPTAELERLLLAPAPSA